MAEELLDHRRAQEEPSGCGRESGALKRSRRHILDEFNIKELVIADRVWDLPQGMEDEMAVHEDGEAYRRAGHKSA